MKQAAVHAKATRRARNFKKNRAEKYDGVAIEPPRYGIDLTDGQFGEIATPSMFRPSFPRVHNKLLISGDQRLLFANGGINETANGALENPGDKSALKQAAEGFHDEGEVMPFAGLIQAAFRRHDLGRVRAHIGGPAGLAARRLGAKAYTIGNHIGFAEEPDLRTAAHEATHVIQQRAGVPLKGVAGQVGDRYEQQADAVADLVVQGKDASGILNAVAGSKSGMGGISKNAGHQYSGVQFQKWGKEYKKKRARPGGLLYEDYKAKIGESGEAEDWAPELKAASEWGGTLIHPIALSRQELGQILKPELPNIPKAVQAHRKRLDRYLPFINQAFEIMGINTMEAQALFLAHAAGESKTMESLSEKGAKKRRYWPFIGRGLLHTTWEHGYVQALAYLETKAERLDDRAKNLIALAAKEERVSVEDVDPGLREKSFSDPHFSSSRLVKRRMPTHYRVQSQMVRNLRAEAQRVKAMATMVRKAFTAIKADITKAEEPQYAFLFSTAFMHMAGGVRVSASLGKQEDFPGNEAEDRWMTSHKNPFNVTLANAIAKKKAARDRLGKAQADGDQDKAKLAQEEVNKAQGAINDMRSAIARAEVKRATYKRAVSVLSNKAAGTSSL